VYIPPPFAVTDLAVLHEAIERWSFALLVSGRGEELIASHLPLLLERQRGAHGTLVGHMARANGQWHAAAGQPVLAVFSGPHAYVSPTWYAAERVVPTWNYVAVHAYGRLAVIEDAVESLDVLRRTVERYESSQPRPWQLADQPAEYIAGLARQIVAFRIPIERLEGKWKLNQNHPAQRRERVTAALAEQGGEAAKVAQLMRQSPDPWSG
jgi:transcriptional regulator